MIVIKRIFKNKYFWMSFFFFIWISFFDKNSLLMHYKLKKNIEKMNHNIENIKKKNFKKK
ncbi:hypothetical protein [Blattabacterium cuenoti]|uniref:hypothetical protein n=1 Tax=Blattabacterium cuenoti TaxID=1653831 RepID=UPI00163CEB86|nr:hypothetical protein [Blattabacterium cuenoti]